jgi:hypothetical protein
MERIKRIFSLHPFNPLKLLGEVTMGQTTLTRMKMLAPDYNPAVRERRIVIRPER